MATRKGGGQIGEVIIEQLRESVRDGIPFHQPQTTYQGRGYADLIYLSTGRFYAVTDFIKARDDHETALELWSALREDLILDHIKHQPRSRPWAWWALEDREPRRRLGRKPCTCPPPVSRPGLPPSNLSCFGHPRGCTCEYESESEYLKRHGLLTKEEKENR